LQITRREFCQTSAAWRSPTAVLGVSSLAILVGRAPCRLDELMKPDALPEMAIGDGKAPVTVIEYASMTFVPHCAHFQETTFPEIKKALHRYR
jgi:protein-disulfide isomerase